MGDLVVPNSLPRPRVLGGGIGHDDSVWIAAMRLYGEGVNSDWRNRQLYGFKSRPQIKKN